VNATRAVRPEVTAYLDEVREALGDVPPDERDDLLAEVEASLVETAEESERPIAARLGPPDAFAAELRSAAGLQTADGQGRETLATRLAERVERALADPRLARAKALYAELAPIWWLLRGYVAVALIALLAGRDWTDRVVPHLPRARFGAAAILVAVVASIALELRARRAQARQTASAGVVVNLVLLVAVVPVVVHLLHTPAPAVVVETVTSPANERGLTLNGVPVDNIYPYSRDGRLLHDVLLYTGSGRPLDVKSVAADPLRRVPVSRGGARLYNAFPVRYYERGTHRVAQPDAGPRIALPRFRTPALKASPRTAAKRPRRSGANAARARIR
jgi:hypothetical protein